MDRPLYEYLEQEYASTYNRRCIDGSVVGCTKCVGYCSYEEHPGFLTKALRRRHDCLGKGCDHYVQKERSPLYTPQPDADRSEDLLAAGNAAAASMDGFRFLRAEEDADQTWTLFYVTISNSYPLEKLRKNIAAATGHSIRLQRLPYTFDNCVKILSQFQQE